MRWLALGFVATPAVADSLVATRVIPAQTRVSSGDVTLVAADIPGALRDPAAALGLETRVAIYPGRALRATDLAMPAIVARNQMVTLVYRQAGLSITTEGRSLVRGGAGDAVRVLNLESRNTVTGRVAADGTIVVGPDPGERIPCV